MADLPERIAQRSGQLLASGGELDSTMQAAEQGLPQILLQQADLAANSALGDGELRCGRRDAPQAGGSFEGAQRGQGRQAGQSSHDFK
jgi:hypothetical protein